MTRHNRVKFDEHQSSARRVAGYDPEPVVFKSPDTPKMAGAILVMECRHCGMSSGWKTTTEGKVEPGQKCEFCGGAR